MYKNVQIDGIDFKDHPDYCDAYACYAEWATSNKTYWSRWWNQIKWFFGFNWIPEDGTELTDDELDALNDSSELHEWVEEAAVDAWADAADTELDRYKETH